MSDPTPVPPDPRKICEVISDILDFENPKLDAAKPETLEKDLQDRKVSMAVAQNLTKYRLYAAVRAYLIKNQRLLATDLDEYTALNLGDASKGGYPFRIDNKTNAKLFGDDQLRKKVIFLSVVGLLLAESRNDPTLGKAPRDLREENGDDVNVVVASGFKKYLTNALAEFDARDGMFEAVYLNLRAKTSVTKGDKTTTATFEARQIAEIARALIGQGTNENDSLFSARFDRALGTSLSGATEGPRSVMDIDLPDLDEGTETDIITDNVMALSAIYFSAMLEELKFFQVMDKVVEQFMTGALPVKRGAAGDPLYRFHRDAQNRISEYERRGLYARSFGVAQGSVDEAYPNREFNDMWIRFLSAVSSRGREIKSTQPITVSEEQVFKSGRDLAVNLSLHGFGLAHFAAVELQNLIKTIKDTLSAPDILAAYGTRDVWQLVERVSNMYLGGAVNGVRQRTMATSGANIIQWLADKSSNLVGAYQTLATDRILTSHAERWLAVTGTTDSTVERYSEPVAVQQQRTIPDFAMPNGAASDAVRDAMSKVNIPGIAMPGSTPQN